MDEAPPGNSNSLPPFLVKTYEMIEDPSTDFILSWSESSRSFVVWNPPEFAANLLPKFFKHSNFSSFIRQLNTYGFRKVDPEQWEFANHDFIRGEPHLMKNIYRRRPIHSHSSHNSQANKSPDSLTKSEVQERRDEIEKLQQDKAKLVHEMQQHQLELGGVELRMQLLKERLQQRNQRQQDMVSFLARILQMPGLALTLLPQSQTHDRKRSRRDGVVPEEENPSLDLENPRTDLFEMLESSVIFWESVLMEFCQSFSALPVNESRHRKDNLNLSQSKSSSDGIDMNCEVQSSERWGDSV